MFPNPRGQYLYRKAKVRGIAFDIIQERTSLVSFFKGFFFLKNDVLLDDKK